jgi:uncharacterized protein (DUF983 family)
MKKFKCPHCEKNTITVGYKFKMGANTDTYCKECYENINTSRWFDMLLHFSSCVEAILIIQYLNKTLKWTYWIAMIVTVIVTFSMRMAIHVLFAPIVKGKDKI